MPFEKGRQKTGGRKKGVKNKITRLKVKSYLETAGVSPVGEIIKLIPNLPPREQIAAWWDIMRFVEVPKKENSPEDELEGLLDDSDDLSDDELNGST